MTTNEHLAAMADYLEENGQCRDTYLLPTEDGVQACALGAWFLTHPRREMYSEARWPDDHVISSALEHEWHDDDETLRKLLAVALGYNKREPVWLCDVADIIAEWSDSTDEEVVIHGLRRAAR